MGEPTCILYYGTSSSNLPGYSVTPNVPYQITAEEGSLVYFYYTYSYPGQGEHNNGNNPDTYVIGSCVSTNISSNKSKDLISFYPNPVTNNLFIETSEQDVSVNIYSLMGKKIDHFYVSSGQIKYNMDALISGIYLVEAFNKEGVLQRIKIIKK